MKKVTTLTLLLGLLALTLPGIAGACHVTDVNGQADCNGWNLCTTVYFTSSVDQGSLAYTVTILDGTGAEVTSFGETLVITHEPGAGEFEYCFEGLWEGEYMVSNPTVVLTSALDGQAPTTFTFDLDCTVAEEAITLDAVKASYR